MSISKDNLNALNAFAVIAEEYCTFIELLKKGRPPQFYHRLESILARLHMGILSVEKAMPAKEHPEFDELRISNEQWNHVAGWIGKAVADEASDLVVWHEDVDGDDEACLERPAMLWDDLAEIYRDLHNGLALWRMGTADALTETVRQWREGYEHHWGKHLFNVMNTVHEARYHLNAE